ncbi:sensor domain-containing diguanylate cyclase [Azospirillum sp. sgz301742]
MTVVLAVALVLIAGSWSVLHVELEHDRLTVAASAEKDAANLSRAFEEHVARTVKNADFLLRILRDDWQESPLDFIPKARRLQAQYGELVVQIGVIAVDGTLLISNLERVKGHIDLSDREHFRIHRDTADDRLFISKPVLGRVSGKWSIQFTRRLMNADGSFGGVIVLSIDPAYFETFYDTVDVGERGAVVLIGLDRVIRARVSRVPMQRSPLGQEAPADRPFLHADQPAAGVYRAVSAVDGVPRINAYRRLHDYPLVVLVVLAENEAFAGHLERREVLTQWTAVFSLVVLAGGLALARLLWMRGRYRARLIADADALQDANDRLLAQQDRLHMVNANLRLLNDIAALGDMGASDKLTAALRLGVSHLGLEMGIISHVEGQDYTVVHCCAPPGADLVPGCVFALGSTYCAITLQADDVVAIEHMGVSPHAGHPCYAAFGLECYIGVPVTVRGERYGTLNFSAARPLPRSFDEADLEFIRLLGRWVNSTLSEERLNEELQHLATVDPLTGMWNRRHFLELANRELERARRYDRPLCVLMLDVDHFKWINDAHGHATGDTALVELAATCRVTLRGSDLLGRLGGEEFAVLLPETDTQCACEVAERLRCAIAAIDLPSPTGPIRLTASIGVAAMHPADASVEKPLSRADEALYRAKAEGRNRVADADRGLAATAG